MNVSRREALARIESCGIVAVIRTSEPSLLLEVCQALHRGGVDACELTMTTPGALQALTTVRQQLDASCLLGIGTVLEGETVRAAISAGADFVVSPLVDLPSLTLANRHDCLLIPGALTPTEVMAAWSAGAELIKLFPAGLVGPRYIRDLHGPFPQVRLTPTGGVDLSNTAAWIAAGAVAVGVGSSLVRPELLRARDWDGLSQLATEFKGMVNHARREPLVPTDDESPPKQPSPITPNPA